MQRVYKKTGHVTYYTRYHIVWIPRKRKKILVPGVASYLKIKFLEVREYYPEIEYIEIGIKRDHVHLCVSVPPSFPIPKLVNILKSNTSTALQDKFKYLKKVYPEGRIWSMGYFMSTVGVNEATVRAYIKRQHKEDIGQATVQLELVSDKKPRP